MDAEVNPNPLDIKDILPVIRDAWGLSESDDEPKNLLGPMSSELGVSELILGAYSQDELVGFLLATEAKKRDETVMYLLGVRKEQQSSGIGHGLMLELKTEALKRGKTRVLLTYDPMNTRCANLYFHKLNSTCSRYRKDPVSGRIPTCSQDIPPRYFEVVWDLEHLNPHKERDYDNAMKYLPKVRTVNDAHPEFLLEVSTNFQDEMRLLGRLAAKEFNRVDSLLEHYINEKGYWVVDFLYKNGNTKAYYKLKRV
jgi:predicted GNAT superfamily acetyltransferase